MNLFQSVTLGIIQGLTEFLPVSSSGHLVIFHKLLQVSPNIPFDAAMHLATLLAVIIYFFKDLLKLLGESRKTLLLIIIASIPTALMGFFLKDFFEGLFHSTFAVGISLLITGGLLLVAETLPQKRKNDKDATILDALVIGTFQGLAITPGISRSGSTIAASLMRGLKRDFAARFSFLLSIPAILGAGLLQAKEITNLGSSQIGLFNLLAGIIAAFFSGYLAIKYFMRLISRHSIKPFAYYCFILGLIIILSSI